MKKRILCFGDSNTWGYNGKDKSRFEEGIRWTSRLQMLLGDDYRVIEEGHNGRTTVWDDPVENRMAGLKYLWPCMESQSPIDLIIIMVGTNDTKNYFGCEAKAIACGAARLVTMAQQSPFGRNNRAPEILLVSPILVLEENGIQHVFNADSARKSKDFAKEYAEVAKELGCHFMDAAQYAAPGPDDGIHLSVEGHEKLAQAMYEKVLEILEERA
ncbi:MAG: SGNH/GDSL hydrolase family protein [Muricoprocola sp.]